MTNQEIGMSIKKIIDQSGLKQKFVAEKSGFSENDFSLMVNGNKVIRAEYLPQIAAALGVAINELFELASEKGNNKEKGGNQT